MKIYKCIKHYSPFFEGGDNDFDKGNYYKVDVVNHVARDSEGIEWTIDDISDYFRPINIFEKLFIMFLWKKSYWRGCLWERGF